MNKFSLFFLLSIIAITSAAQEPSVQNAYKLEIDVIASDQRVQKAFGLIQEMEFITMKNLIELTEIPAPPFMEEKRGVRFMEMLKTAGVDSVWIDEVGNVLALRKGKKGGKTVVFEAHLDTVFPIETDVKVKMKGDTLYAPGIGDDTRGLSMVITVLEAMNFNKALLLSNIPGHDSLINKKNVNGLYFEKKNEIDLSNKIIWMINNKKKIIKFSKNSKKNSLMFSSEKINQKYYEAII